MARFGWLDNVLFNQTPDLRIAARAFGGVEDTDGGFIFREAEVAQQAANLLGITFDLPNWLQAGRSTKLKEHKDGRLIVEIKHEDRDIVTPEMSAWLIKKGNWQRIFNIYNTQLIEPEVNNYDDIIRHLVNEGNEDCGWVIKSEGAWVQEPYLHVKTYLQSLSLPPKEVVKLLGSSINRCWRLVNLPFQDEYLGDRQWNRSAAQFRFAPSDTTTKLFYPTWDLLLDHIGQALDSAIKEHPWAQENHVLTGADYLKCWISSLFKFPTEPLPYLFLWGPQNSGKSIFHEALELLVTAGVVRADTTLTNNQTFNAELENAVLCVIEETDLKRNKVAYNRIKDWVVSRRISIHRKGSTPYMLTNTSHWVHCSNDLEACPVFPGDSRITMIYVPPLDKIVPKRELVPKLSKEAPDFLAYLLNLDLPFAQDRLSVPVIETEDKIAVAQSNRTHLEEWLEDCCHYAPGECIKYADLYEAFKEWLEPNLLHEWSMIRFGKELPKNKFPKGRSTKDAQWMVGNISFAAKQPTNSIYKVVGDKLVLFKENTDASESSKTG